MPPDPPSSHARLRTPLSSCYHPVPPQLKILHETLIGILSPSPSCFLSALNLITPLPPPPHPLNALSLTLSPHPHILNPLMHYPLTHHHL